MAKDRAKTWRSRALGDTLFLTGEFRELHFDPHFHDEFAIGVIDGGCQAFTYDGNRRLDMTKGSVALIAPGVVHTGWPGLDEGWRYSMFYPSAELVKAAAEDVFARADVATFHQPRADDPTLSRALTRLHSLSAQAEADPLELESLFLRIIRWALQHHAGHAPCLEISGERRAVAPMRDILEANFQNPIALATLAEEVGLSRFQALRRFKAAYGLPPHAYLRQVRVRRAHQMIMRGEALASAAASAGFADQAHMTRVFRQTVGYTPGDLARA